MLIANAEGDSNFQRVLKKTFGGEITPIGKGRSSAQVWKVNTKLGNEYFVKYNPFSLTSSREKDVYAKILTDPDHNASAISPAFLSVVQRKESDFSWIQYESAGQTGKVESLAKFEEKFKSRGPYKKTADAMSKTLNDIADILHKNIYQRANVQGDDRYLRDLYNHILPADITLNGIESKTIDEKYTPEDLWESINERGEEIQGIIQIEAQAPTSFQPVEISKNSVRYLHAPQDILTTAETPFLSRGWIDKWMTTLDQSNYSFLKIDCKNMNQNGATETISGKVVKTRRQILLNNAQAAFPGLDLTEQYVNLFGMQLPNPILKLGDILSSRPYLPISFIHGDCNLENILLVPDIRIIDYATVGPGHESFDFIKLEVEIRNHFIDAGKRDILPQVFELEVWLIKNAFEETQQRMPSVGSKSLRGIYQTIQKFRDKVKKIGLGNNRFRDYYGGLCLYALNTTKYKNLVPCQKRIAFMLSCIAAEYFLNTPKEIRDDFFTSIKPQKISVEEISQDS